MNRQKPESEYRGHRLFFVSDGAGWCTGGRPDFGPMQMDELMRVIDQYEADKQIRNGITIWNLSDKRPAYWGKRTAVFFRNAQLASDRALLTNQNTIDPDYLYSIPLSKCALDTPEVVAAIEKARALHKEAIDAGEKYREAVKEIPTATVADVSGLPVRNKK